MTALILAADARPDSFWGTSVPCAGKWALFDSTRLDDHREAAAICATCPLPQVAACRSNLAETQAGSLPGAGPVGTWAGELLTPPAPKPTGRPLPREHGTDRGYYQHRYRQEWACEECLAAHNAREKARKVAS